VNCPNCDKIIQGGASICPWCGVLVTNSDAGVVASAGKRLAGYLVDVAVWIFIWFIITTMIVVGSAETDNFGLAVLGIILLLVTVVYYFILLSRGKSYGKWILGMKYFALPASRQVFGLCWSGKQSVSLLADWFFH